MNEESKQRHDACNDGDDSKIRQVVFDLFLQVQKASVFGNAVRQRSCPVEQGGLADA